MQIPERTQFKHVVYGPQKWGAYEDAFFPAIRDSIEDGDWDLANTLVERTAQLMANAASVLVENGNSRRWWTR